MSKLIRVDDECEAILRKYSDGSLSDCIRSMESAIINYDATTKGKNALTVDEFRKGMADFSSKLEKIKEGQKVINVDILDRLDNLGIDKRPHYEGPKVVGPNGPATFGFRTASEVKEEK